MMTNDTTIQLFLEPRQTSLAQFRSYEEQAKPIFFNEGRDDDGHHHGGSPIPESASPMLVIFFFVAWITFKGIFYGNQSKEK